MFFGILCAKQRLAVPFALFGFAFLVGSVGCLELASKPAGRLIDIADYIIAADHLVDRQGLSQFSQRLLLRHCRSRKWVRQARLGEVGAAPSHDFLNVGPGLFRGLIASLDRKEKIADFLQRHWFSASPGLVDNSRQAKEVEMKDAALHRRESFVNFTHLLGVCGHDRRKKHLAARVMLGGAP